jgi:hypothetical protein
MRIDQKLYSETGSRYIPLENKRQPWQRLDCPFCEHKRAVISYAANWFQCWACGEKRSGYAGDTASLAVVRFARQIDKAVRKVKADFGDWLNHLDEDDVKNTARFYVWTYAEGEPGDPYDAGMLAKWETDYNAEEEPYRLEGKVQSVLDRDLLNWAEGLKRWKERNQLVGDTGSAGGSATSDDDFGDQAKTIISGLVRPGVGYKLRYREAQNAVKYGIGSGERNTYFESKEPPGTRMSGPMKYGELRRCDLMRNGAGPIPGHCPWCNKALGLAAEVPQNAIDLYHEEDSDELREQRRGYPYLVANLIDGFTVAEIARKQGISETTVNRRLSKEKSRYRQCDLTHTG